MLDWEWFSEPSTTSLFLYFLLSANLEDKQWKGMVVKRGQFVTSINAACEKCGITPRAFRTSLKRLIATKEVTSKTTSKYTIITICNYDYYQYKEAQSDKVNDKVNDKEDLFATPCVSDSYEHSEDRGDKVNDKVTTSKTTKQTTKKTTTTKNNIDNSSFGFRFQAVIA